MGVAMTLQEFMESHDLHYDLVEHTHTDSSMRTAEAAHIPGDQLAKPVLLGDEDSYLLAVIPATHRLELDRLNQMMARQLQLITEAEMESTFSDCEKGAIPPIGSAYGIDTVVDMGLTHQEDVYFESGDHEHLVHMKGEDFRHLMEDIPRVHISHHF